MSYLLRSRRVAYDNIATTGAGGGTGVTGVERTILGQTASTPASRDRIMRAHTSPSTAMASSTEPTSTARDRIITAGSSGVTSANVLESIMTTAI